MPELINCVRRAPRPALVKALLLNKLVTKSAILPADVSVTAGVVDVSAAEVATGVEASNAVLGAIAVAASIIELPPVAKCFTFPPCLNNGVGKPPI